MRITDDGCGIAAEDVATAFLRHATSKINEKDDLDNICTLGFRGEALASVAAVAKVELMTKRKSDEYGTCYCIEGSIEKSCEPSGCPDGTTIIIRDLFYNVPVRRKFMKKDVTEANAVSQIMQKIALSHPEISFKLIRDNRMEFNTGGDGELYSAVYSIFGRDFARDLIRTEYEYEGVNVSGYVVKPLYAKSNRTFQNFFVNRRYVKSKLCSAALENAYENLIMTGKFPACVLMIEVSPNEIDVNIHPAKAEIRFTNEKKITDAVYFAIKNAFMDNGLIYEFQMRKPVDWAAMPAEEPQEEYIQQEMIFTPVEKIEEEYKAGNISEELFQEFERDLETLKTNYLRIAYVMYLFDLPNNKYNKKFKNKKSFNKERELFEKGFNNLKVDDLSIHNENIRVINNVKKIIKEAEKNAKG
jgi:DNA mismatch repair protein MutL